MNRITLSGLTVEDYMHPDEKFFADKNPGKLPLLRKGINLLNDLSVQFVRQITEGKWVELSQQTAPEVFDVAQEACRILNWSKVPRIFVRRERDLKITVGGTDYSQMLIPDYILTEFDRQMQLFALGNALSMFKGGHVQLATISSVLCGGMLTAPLRMTLMAYLRAADLSSDRGGLLCCQNFSAAARCILVETGMPMSELRFLDDDETLQFVENYLSEAEVTDSDMLTENAKLYKRLVGDVSPAPIRLRELLTWYRGDYEKILARRSAQ